MPKWLKLFSVPFHLTIPTHHNPSRRQNQSNPPESSSFSFNNQRNSEAVDADNYNYYSGLNQNSNTCFGSKSLNHINSNNNPFSMAATTSASPAGKGQFRSYVWDPILLISQIFCMQAIFYLSLTAFICILDSLTASSRSLDQLFRYQSFFIRDLGGRKLYVAYMLNAIVCGFGMWYVVGRAKLCLDFAGSIHVIHLILSTVYNGAIPTFLSWWLLQIVAVTVTTVLAEYLCMHTEMKAIPLSLSSSLTPPTGASAAKREDV